MITVFTPTYNRRKELEGLYASLINQTDYDFEWLIVDDGSKDDTKKFINKIIKENKINVRYIYKENGGKQSAYNRGLEEAKGDIFLCIDSDDILDKKAIKTIKLDFKKITKKSAGYAYVQGYISDRNKIIGTDFGELKSAYYYDIYGKYNVKGDKLIVLKTEIAKEYSFPLIEGEKFVPEALVYNRIAKKYKFDLSNKVLAYKDYLPGGYSDNYFNLVKRNPKGNTLYFKEKYEIESTFYNVYGYVLFSIYSKYSLKKILSEHPSKIKILALYLPTLLISHIKGRKK